MAPWKYRADIDQGAGLFMQASLKAFSWNWARQKKGRIAIMKCRHDNGKALGRVGGGGAWMNALWLSCIEATPMNLSLACKFITAFARGNNRSSSMTEMHAAREGDLERATCIMSIALHASAMACLLNFGVLPPACVHHHKA